MLLLLYFCLDLFVCTYDRAVRKWATWPATDAQAENRSHIMGIAFSW